MTSGTEHTIAHRLFQGNPNRDRKHRLNRLEGRSGEFQYVEYRRDGNRPGCHVIRVGDGDPIVVSARDFDAFLSGLEVGINLIGAVAGPQWDIAPVRRLCEATEADPLAPIEPIHRLEAPAVTVTAAPAALRVRWPRVDDADLFTVQARNAGLRRPVWETLAEVQRCAYDWHEAVPGLTYDIRVIAKNRSGQAAESDPSPAVRVTAPDPAP